MVESVFQFVSTCLLKSQIQREWQRKTFRKGSYILDWGNKKQKTQKKGRQENRTWRTESKIVCKADEIQIYSTRSETESAFAEGTFLLLKNILYSYL